MQFIRNHKKISIIVLIILISTLITTVAYGRYFYNIIHNSILESKQFYFNSNVLSINTKNYQINNWDGVSNYYLQVDLNNRKNSSRYTKSDITYEIEMIYDNTKVQVTTSKQGDIIRENDHTDSYQIVITPITSFSAGSSVTVTTKAKSTFPYEKTLSASYTLRVVTSNFTYNIEDEPNSMVFALNLTNSLAFYEDINALGTHTHGQRITKEAYEALTPVQQEGYYSAIVTLTFNPQYVLLDSTDNTLRNRLSTDYQETTINGNNYVSKYSFKVDALSNTKVLFYKVDPTQNYTYPVTNSSSIVTVDVALPED